MFLPTSTFSSLAVIDESTVCLVIVFELDLEKFALVLVAFVLDGLAKLEFGDLSLLNPMPTPTLYPLSLYAYLSLTLSKLRLFPTFKFNLSSALKFAPLMVVSLAVFIFISLAE